MDVLCHAAAPVAVAFLLGFLLGRFVPSRPDAILLPDDSIGDEQIEAEVRAGRRIEAMRLYRRRHACGPKPAKQAVDDLALRMKRGG